MTRNPVIPYLIIGVAGILLIIVLSSFGINQMNKEASGDDGEEVVVDPSELYQQNCSSCHGGNLEGGAAGPSLEGLGDKYDVDEIANIIDEGIPPSMPGGLVTGEAQQLLAEWLAEQ